MTSTTIGEVHNVHEAESKPRFRWTSVIPIAFWIVALAAGAYQVWVNRNAMSNDGISYLDMGDALAHGHWSAAINGYWSPLYPVLIGIALAVVRPSAWNEFATVHAVNFAIYAAALASFEFFLRGLIRTVQPPSMPAWLIKVIGYSLFIWSSLDLIGNGGASPDMAVSLFVFMASGILLTIAHGRARRWTFVLLGVVLAFGYLAKAPLFPLAFAFFGLALFAPGGIQKTIPKVAVGLLAFAVVSAPYLLSLSQAKGRLTFGDSGKLNYAWYVDSASYRHWQGGNLGPPSEVAPRWSKPQVSSGVPLHPTRKVLDTPPVYEFNGPIQGTYPVWYDPSYWNDGIKPRFDPSQQIRKIAVNVKFMYSLLLNLHILQLYREKQVFKLFSPVVLLLWIAWLFQSRKLAFVQARPAWLLFSFAIAALAMYSLVYCEPRHLAPFVVLLFMSMFAFLLPPKGNDRLLTGATLATVLAAFALATGSGLIAAQPPKVDDWAVASALRHLGIGPGTQVASVEYSNHANVKWARLARARIVAEVYTDAFAPRGYFWKLGADSQASAVHAFREAGAQFAVASDLPSTMSLPAGWEHAGNTNYILYRLK
jgi:hypothetical protein